jgi:hypothetical protein
MADITKQIVNALEVIKDDWSKLPNFIKYCFLVALFIILGGGVIQQNDNILNKSLSFWLLVTLAIFVIILPVLYWLCIALKIKWLKIRYPYKKLGFINHNGTVYLVHIKRKQIHWIVNPRTLYDLGYFPYVWEHAVNVDNLSQSVKLNSETVELSKLSIKSKIRTRDKPPKAFR